MKPKQPADPAMTLGNMRALGVQRLVASSADRRFEVPGGYRSTVVRSQGRVRQMRGPRPTH